MPFTHAAMQTKDFLSSSFRLTFHFLKRRMLCTDVYQRLWLLHVLLVFSEPND